MLVCLRCLFQPYLVCNGLIFVYSLLNLCFFYNLKNNSMKKALLALTTLACMVVFSLTYFLNCKKK